MSFWVVMEALLDVIEIEALRGSKIVVDLKGLSAKVTSVDQATTQPHILTFLSRIFFIVSHNQPPLPTQQPYTMGTGKKEANRKIRQGKVGDGMANVKTKGENFYRFVFPSSFLRNGG